LIGKSLLEKQTSFLGRRYKQVVNVQIKRISCRVLRSFAGMKAGECFISLKQEKFGKFEDSA
jgi:hypothetical protein